MTSALIKAVNSKGKRRLFIITAFLITTLLTIVVLLSVMNLVQRNYQLDRATLSQGLQFVSKYCKYSSKDGINVSSIKQEVKDLLENTSSEERRQFALELDVQDSVLDEALTEKFYSLLFRTSVIRDTMTINIELHPKGKLPFHSLTRKEIQFLEGAGKSQFLKTWKPFENREIYGGLEDFNAFFEFLNITHISKCELDIHQVLPVPTLELMKLLIVSGLTIENVSRQYFYDFESFTDLPKSTVNAYRNFDSWDGGYILSLTNPDVQVVDSNPIQFSILLPNNPSTVGDFLDNAILVILCTWLFLCFFLLIPIEWLVSAPLRLLSQASSKAGEILTKKENIPENLKSTREGFHADTTEFPEFETLLFETEVIFREREILLGRHFHHLKNDLIAISNTVKIIENSKSDTSSISKKVENLIYRISSVINSVASYQVALYGKPEPKTLVDLGSVIETVRDEIEDAGGDATCSGDNNIYLNAQSTSLQSAFQNLIWNAHHHGGKVTIEFNKICQGKKVEVFIDDDGPGIDDEKIESMFEPYRQGEISAHKLNRSFRGAGLGLTIAKYIISEHGGQIDISNRRKDDGSIAGLRVRVVLPLSI